ncbi:hypothetical protein QQF64_022587 [Cirrhinus molitorella]|uniref:Uncharacterized protein n=1 Tax=Cirrhinus molitorella TaxID=172907 RepID=A0ABR3L592_9TELE
MDLASAFLSLGTVHISDESHENTLSSVCFSRCRLVSQTSAINLRKPYAQSHPEIKLRRTKAKNAGHRERDWGCSAETDGEIACRNIALCGSRATLQTQRQNDSSGVRSPNRPPRWRLNALLSSIPSRGEWLLELIMQEVLYRANSRGFKIRLDEALAA